ncbi:OmpA family protein [Helicobacter ailurogastricus]|uniref:Tol-Pal system peptidoglycan-associated lipoprotein PAL n=1 Tax=Helicobacter ailurogastricus TaxID=1578720 RepID=A0A0K2XEQ4_9HELI|nr:OmpA family protein [Helicobacter ailurogastricus]CRF41279.1 Tol-Pal system peptidoglycan-associated lipoprotein PAL [Helicobacter ailurogastricus]CRF43334.1 Tol-Pal system peptidoglycan-associated lipoprotein PAL [Helicobacter ailurogastricus]CRF44571.1 Tol-Pal system peptidoglycan-associated lipoprotein PAL [Helicobacter ailurogastricus]
MNKWFLAGAVLACALITGCAGSHQDEAAPEPKPAPQAQQAAPEPAPKPEEHTVPKEEVQTKPVEKPKPHAESGTIVGQVYFDFDKYNVREDMQSAIDEAAKKVQEYGMKVLLEGNTDEFGTGEYNFALGNKRGLSVKDVLTVKGISADDIKVVSFGETKPICQEKTKECYRKNRRVDIKVVD